MPELEPQSTIWKKIRRLDLPREAKKGLRTLWHQARTLVQAIVNWISQRRQFCSAVMLGVAVAYLLHPIPIVGEILATLSISLAVLYGIALQFRADLDKHFRFIIEGRAV
jgi:hypothetical protein